MTDLTNTAPKRIYLDIGDQFALERVASGSLRWDLLDGVTWSEDNATSHGIPYVRADLVPTPAASGAAPALPEAIEVACIGGVSMEVFSADQMRAYAIAALASPQVAPAKVYLVATGEVVDGMETYTRHEGAPPPLCDSELLFATPVQVAPPGWKLVPIEITEEMHVASVKTATRCTGNADFPPRVYRAMLAVAPAAPVAPQNDARDAIRREAFEEAADAAESEATGDPRDEHYDSATRMCAAAIRALSTPAAKPTGPADQKGGL